MDWQTEPFDNLLWKEAIGIEKEKYEITRIKTDSSATQLQRSSATVTTPIPAIASI